MLAEDEEEEEAKVLLCDDASSSSVGLWSLSVAIRLFELQNPVHLNSDYSIYLLTFYHAAFHAFPYDTHAL